MFQVISKHKFINRLFIYKNEFNYITATRKNYFRRKQHTTTLRRSVNIFIKQDFVFNSNSVNG